MKARASTFLQHLWRLLSLAFQMISTSPRWNNLTTYCIVSHACSGTNEYLDIKPGHQAGVLWSDARCFSNKNATLTFFALNNNMCVLYICANRMSKSIWWNCLHLICDVYATACVLHVSLTPFIINAEYKMESIHCICFCTSFFLNYSQCLIISTSLSLWYWFMQSF